MLKNILPIVAALLLAAVARADNLFQVPVIFTTGSSIQVGSDVPLTGTWDFSGADNVIGVPPASLTLTGNVTGTGTSSITTVVTTIPDLVSAPGSILSTNIAGPGSPASGKTKWYTDSSDKRFHDRNDTGSTGTTVVGGAAVTHQFITAIGTDGAITRAQPALSDIAGSFGGVASVTSTVDQTGTSEQVHVSFSVPGNSAAVGTVYRIVAWGDIDNGTSAISFTPRLRWGGTGGTELIATPTIAGTTSAQSNRTWKAMGEITIRATGATGTAFCSLAISNHTADSSGAYGADEADAANITIDTTVSKSLALTWTLSGTTGTPHVRTYGGYVEVVKP